MSGAGSCRDNLDTWLDNLPDKEAKETQPMSDTLQERESQSEWFGCCQGYDHHMPWCPAYKEPDTRRSGEMGHRTNHEQPASQHQPAARGGDDEWHILETITRTSVVSERGEDIAVGLGRGTRQRREHAMQIVTEHNQHQSLVAERDAYKSALEEIAAYRSGYRFSGAVSDKNPVGVDRENMIHLARGVLRQKQRSTSE